jgi:creatinine amidohydrolase
MPARPHWRHYHELRPDELNALRDETPVAFWPLGLLEHHGWHLPVGYDGIKAERLCIRIAERTGGVMLPIMWWGTGGGHDAFLWTHYQPPEAVAAMLTTTVEQLIAFDFRVIVLMAGHYPWQGILDNCLPAIQETYPEVTLLWGTEASIGGEAVPLPGDHAAREETSYGLTLFPELVKMDALTPGRDEADTWPAGRMPPEETRHPGVVFDTKEPLFAQFGEDARQGSAKRGEEGLLRLVDYLANKICETVKA